MYASFLGNFPHRKFCLLKSVLVEGNGQNQISCSDIQAFFRIVVTFKKMQDVVKDSICANGFIHL